MGSQLNKGGSSRSGRGKSKGSSDKPRQPQRGLGVAQLEKIRLQSQSPGGYYSSYGSMHTKEEDPRMQMGFAPQQSSADSTSFSMYGPSQSFVVGFGDLERRHARYSENFSCVTDRSMSNQTIAGDYHFQKATPTVTLPLLRQSDEESAYRKSQEHWDTLDASSFDSSDHEIDLDLKLSR